MTGVRQRRAWLGVPLLLVLQAALVRHDLTHSNRPHELRFVWPVALAAAAAAWLTLLAWREVRELSSERSVSGLVALSVLTLASLALGVAGVATLLGG